MRRFKKPLIGLVLLFGVYSLLGFFALPPILKSILIKKLSENLHREVNIEKIQVNPYILSLTARGLEAKEPGSSETFAACEELFLNLQSLSALRRELILKEIRVRKPFFHLVRNVDGSYNFSDLLEKKSSAGAEKAFLFSLNNIQVLDGSIDFWDQGPGKKHTAREINLSISSISNTPQRVQIFVQPLLSAKLNGTPYELRGKTKPFADSLETVFDIEFQDLDLTYYLAYVPFKMNFRVPSALLDTKAKITFVRSKDKPPSVTIKGDLALKKLAIDDGEGKPVFRLPRLDIAVASLEPMAGMFHLAKVAIESPEFEIRRNPNGSFSFESLIPEVKEQKKETKTKEDSTPFAIEIDEFSLTGGKVFFSDLSQKEPFKTTLSPVELKVVHFSNGKDKRTDFAASLVTEAKESAKVEGNLSIDPLQVEGALELKNISLRKYSPYYHDRINFDLADGALDLATQVQYARKEKEMPLSLKGLSLSLRSLRLKRREEKEDFLRIPLLTVQETGLDLSRKELKVGRVSTERGTLAVTRLKEGTIDLMDLFPPLPKEKEEKTAPGPPWVLTLGQLTLNQYTVKMRDLSLPAPVTLLAEKISVRGENISTGKGQKGNLSLSLLLDQRTTLSTRSAISLDPLRVDGSAEIKRLPFRPYSPYYQDRILFQIEGGELEAQTRYHYSKSENASEIRITELSSSLLGLKLQKKGEQEPFLSIPAVSIKGASLDLNKREVFVREISTRDGAVQIQRSKTGEINWLPLFPSTPGDPSPEKKIPPSDEKPWALKVGKIAVDQYQIKLEDRFPPEPATLSIQDLVLKAENFSTGQGQRADASLAFRLNEKGNVALEGSMGMNPMAADLKVTLKGIPIGPLQPYFSDRVKLVVNDGSLSTAGTLTLNSREGAGWQATFKGNSSVNNFASVDKNNAEDFLKWESLSVSGMDVGYNPLYVHIDGIALSNFYSRLIIHADGSLNVQNILGKNDQQPKAPTPSSSQKAPSGDKTSSAPSDSPIPDIKIARVTLQGGQINFSDEHIQPHYSTDLTEVGGRVSDLNAAEMQSGDVELHGMWNKTEPVEITGKVNPVAQDLFVDLNVRLKDIELSPFTPYAGKYVGYTIQKGKLAMDLKYLIVKRKLESQNKIFFDQFTLGDRVESPQATKLPVKFALSLLKDRKGEIRLDIPVTGSLDDPKFSVFKIIFQVIGNLLAKAATSPFALVSAMIGGGGEHLEYAEFEYGSAEVKGETVNKLNTIVKVLQDRPEIRLDVEGHVDMEKDREALKTLFFQRKIKTEKMKEITRKGQPSVPVDAIKIEPAEYEQYLRKAYGEEKFPKPKNFLGFEKKIPVPEMEKLMFAHTEVKEGDLRDLALQRSTKVKDFLAQEGKIEPERIFLLEAKSLSPEKKENLKESRVVFALR